MLSKSDFIREQKALYPKEPIASFASMLNTPILVDNPKPQATIQKPITIDQAFAIVPDTEAFAISETRTYDRLLDAFNQGRMDWVQNNISTLIAGGKMSSETAQALSALMTQTEPDPNWQPKVYLSPAQVAGFDIIYTNEIEEALI
jgi:hypothetical protein